MSIIINIVFNLLLIILIILFLVTIFPIHYTFSGGYNNRFYGHGKITLLKFCQISFLINVNNIIAKLNFFGFSININEKAREKKYKPKDFKVKNLSKNKKKEKKQNIDYSGFIKQLLQKDIILHFFHLLKDLLLIIKPQVLKLTGKIGFSEPHHTAWLHAILELLSSTKANFHLDVETVWDDEYYQINLLVKGHFIILVILARILKFILSKNTWKVWRIYRREVKSV